MIERILRQAKPWGVSTTMRSAAIVLAEEEEREREESAGHGGRHRRYGTSTNPVSTALRRC
jgi:hypothetical protein